MARRLILTDKETEKVTWAGHRWSPGLNGRCESAPSHLSQPTLGSLWDG